MARPGRRLYVPLSTASSAGPRACEQPRCYNSVNVYKQGVGQLHAYKISSSLSRSQPSTWIDILTDLEPPPAHQTTWCLHAGGTWRTSCLHEAPVPYHVTHDTVTHVHITLFTAKPLAFLHLASGRSDLGHTNPQGTLQQLVCLYACQVLHKSSVCNACTSCCVQGLVHVPQQMWRTIR